MVDRRIKNVKIELFDRAKEVQLKLFELGAGWSFWGKTLLDPTQLNHLFLFKYIYVNSVGRMTHGDSPDVFKGESHKELSVDELLAMPVVANIF